MANMSAPHLWSIKDEEHPEWRLVEVFTDYEGDEPYADFVETDFTSEPSDYKFAYEPGMWRKDLVGGSSEYLHNDHLGTLRQTTGSSGALGTQRVFTAFGERIAGPSTPDRYGYVGAHGYQTHDDLPFQHVGARYYDPSSGRFLQRDPIGIVDGNNIYEYVSSRPTQWIDPIGHAKVQSFWPPNTGRFRYGPSRGPGRAPGSYAFRFPGPKGGPHWWGARGAAAFGASCFVAAGTGAVAGRVIDNSFGNSNNGFRISDGLADVIFRWWNDDPNYDPWG